ncbi:OmpA family protein [Enhydrobacter aerosaccus]|uniref:OmpA family protein n=1 Tax=Enhydrobacter aerosaccus TaxID=225324 RepID=A0A1T4PE85_9HYPH|nr:OmpA family protein [Enhydrobacter aerosaccus]SJZ89860.1 OmpA family protein [Enhydrobacter aerosaccus]
MRVAALFVAGALVAASPALAQTVATCPVGTGAAAESQPVWILFDLGSAKLRPNAKPAIAEAVRTATARQSVKVCVIGQTDKLGDKNYNARLARERAQTVATELVHAGLSASKVVIASNPEAFGNLSFGERNAQEEDRRVTIVFR